MRFVMCVTNGGSAASLEKRKVYAVLPDSTAAKRGLMRVIDESGEDYLYPKGYFVPVTLPQSAHKAVLTAA